MFTAELFTIARLWKHPRCPTANKRINKAWYLSKWNFTQPQRRMKFCHWMDWRTSSSVKLARFRRPKIMCSPFRPRTNAVILLGTGYMLRGEHIQEE
jgi:hypothetical protein